MAKTKTKEAPTLFAEQPAEAKREVAVIDPRNNPAPASRKKNTQDAPAPTNLLAAVVQAVSDPKCQPDKMHALLDVRDRVMREEAHVQFTAAYIEMQAELPTIDANGRIEIEAKTAGRKKQSTPYATYNEINRVTKPILKKHKFALMMLPDVGPAGVGVIMRGQLAFVCDTQYGRMVHVERCVIGAPLETSGSKNNVQGIGSSLSYTKRYCAIALLNIVSHAPEDKDDDGRAAGRPAEAEQTISAEQVAELDRAIKDCGVPIETFLNRYEIEKLPDLPAKRFAEAVKACANFKQRNNNNAGQAEARA